MVRLMSQRQNNCGRGNFLCPVIVAKGLAVSPVPFYAERKYNDLPEDAGLAAESADDRAQIESDHRLAAELEQRLNIEFRKIASLRKGTSK